MALATYVTRAGLLGVAIFGIIASLLVIVPRMWIRWVRSNGFHADDYFLLFALAVYLSLCSLYIADIPYLFAISDLANGKRPMVPEMFDIYRNMMKISFAVTAFFWTILWSVKLSLLMFFQRLVRNTKYMKIWWAVLGFVIVTYLASLVTEFTSCNSISSFLILGECQTPSEARAQNISLFFSYAADMCTDLAIMLVPIQILPKLKRSMHDKVILGILFSVSLLAMFAATLRVFFVWAKTGSTSPSPGWLALWAMIECLVAIITGSIPGLFQGFKTWQSGSNNSRPTYDSAARRQSQRLPSDSHADISGITKTTAFQVLEDPSRNTEEYPLRPIAYDDKRKAPAVGVRQLSQNC